MQTKGIFKISLLALATISFCGMQFLFLPVEARDAGQSVVLIATRREGAAPKQSKEDQAIAIVWRRPEVKAWLKLFPRGKSKSGGSPSATADADKGDIYNVHVYEDFSDHIATFGWYTVNLKNGKATKQEP